MATHEFGVRELRNHTSRVLRAVESGDVVYLTNRGKRVAEIHPVREDRPIDALIERAARISSGDTGAFDELMAAKESDVEAQADRDEALWP